MINWYLIIACVAQAIAIITFPPIVRVGMPFGIVICALLVPLTLYILWVQSYDEAPLFPKLVDLVELENGGIVGRTLVHVGMIIGGHLGLWFMYSHNWWHMTDGEWLFMYINMIVIIYCSEKARKRNLGL
jgi:hypothetical protein